MTDDAEFTGTDRFTVRRRLGSGGFGVVYEAFDLARGSPLALKVLRRTTAADLVRFKQEFRALTDVKHTNLVTLYELIADRDEWFFTMELVRGAPFIDYVRGTASAASFPRLDTGFAQRAERRTVRLASDSAAEPPRSASDPPAEAVSLDLDRLRNALDQLATGVSFLHELGKLHRDIEPSNVMVDDAGRVVVLDFGLVTDSLAAPRGRVVGTPGFMSPEQARGAAATPQSDWYAVGAVLYAALTGEPPHPTDLAGDGAPPPYTEPPRADEVVAGLPTDLCELCADLLSPIPELRPTGDEVARRAGRGRRRRRRSLPARSVNPPDMFAGRSSEVAALCEAFEEACQGTLRVVSIEAAPGLGKSALCAAFLGRVRDKRPDAFALAGRCHRAELVPYEALDGPIDQLSRYLGELPPDRCAAIAPRDAPLLARLFPVLRDLPGFGGDAPEPAGLDAPALRRRGASALRDLLTKLARAAPVVLLIDDLQWADVDSAAVLEQVLAPPDPPSLLLVTAHREGADIDAAFTRDHAAARVVVLDPLDDSAARELVRAICGEDAPDDATVAAILLEAAGNPFLLVQLAGSSHARRLRRSPDPVTIDRVIARQVAALSPDARQLLDVLSLAGQPIRRDVACAVAAVAHGGLDAVATLRAWRLARESGRRSDDALEPYHDRIRETVSRNMGPRRRRALHGELARAFERHRMGTAEGLAFHWHRGGHPDRAGRYALTAGDRAVATLAFDRAVRMYRIALDGASDGGAGDEIRERLAGALVNAGRGGEAGAEYRQLASTATGERASALRRLAAEQYLRAGYIEQGLDELQRALAGIGVRMSSTARRAVPSLLWARARLAFRGLRIRATPESAVPSTRLHRADVLRAATLGLGLIDLPRAAMFSARSTLAALRAGEPRRAAVALATEAAMSASDRNQRRARALLERAEQLRPTGDDAQLDGFFAGVRATLLYEQARWAECQEACDHALHLLRGRCTGVAWELRTMELLALSCSIFLGDFARLDRCVHQWLGDADRRGDRYAAANFRTLALPALQVIGNDDPEEARRTLDEALREWPPETFYLQHMFALFTATIIDRYTGDSCAAHRRCNANAAQVRSSLLLHDRAVGAFFAYLRGSSAAGAAAADATVRRHARRIARRDAARLRRDGAPAYSGMAGLIDGALATDAETAANMLQRAAVHFDDARMTVFAAVARTRAAQVLCASTTAPLAMMHAHGVRDPSRLCNAFAPGFAAL